MKLKLALAAWLLPMAVMAEEADKQSIYMVSDTVPVVVTSSSTRIGPFSDTVRAFRIATNTGIHFKFGGSSVAADVSSSYLPPESSETFKRTPTSGNYLAITRDSADGKAFVDSMIP